MHIIFMQIQLLGNLLIGHIQTHQVQARNPGLQPLMTTGKDRVG
jgi:hypothetical protein